MCFSLIVGKHVRLEQVKVMVGAVQGPIALDEIQMFGSTLLVAWLSLFKIEAGETVLSKVYDSLTHFYSL